MDGVPLFDDISQQERQALVRYCARVTGDARAAEDLAQQALLEEWRKRYELSDTRVRMAWLYGMARNVCLRWMRARASTESRFVPLSEQSDGMVGSWIDGCDLNQELERDDLARLLDRTLALLPAQTRLVLVHRYVDGVPQAEVAARLGLSEGAVEAIVQRGKQAFLRMLTVHFRDEARTYGLIPSSADLWQETRIWCLTCGTRRLIGRFTDGYDLQLDCPGCYDGARAIIARSQMAERSWHLSLADLFAGIKGYKPALNRLITRLHECYAPGMAGRTAYCPVCSHVAPLRTGAHIVFGYRDVKTDCLHCGQVCGIAGIGAVALSTPAGRAFWREHKRIRTCPGRPVEVDGVPAIVARFEDVTGQSALDVILGRDTLDVIAIHGGTEHI